MSPAAMESSVASFGDDVVPVRAGSVVAEAVAAAIPVLLLIGISFMLLVRERGGIDPAVWQPVALFAAALLATLAIGGGLPTLPRGARLPLVAGFLLAVWTAVGMVWTASPDGTVEHGATLVLLLACALAGAVAAPRRIAAAVVTTAIAVGVVGVAIGAVVMERMHPGSVFLGARLTWPVGYPNATGAAMVLGLMPCIAAVANPSLVAWARTAAAFGGALCLSVAVTTESRAVFPSMFVGLLVLLLARRGQAGKVTAAGASIIGPVALFGGLLVAGNPALHPGDGANRAFATIAAAVLAAIVASVGNRAGRVTVIGAFWRRVEPLLVPVAMVGVVAAVLLATGGRPDRWVHQRWTEFSTVSTVTPDDASRLRSGRSNRYEYWRVSLDTVQRHPVLGVGAGAFPVAWYRHRRIDESVTDPHGWPFQALAETGILGALLWFTLLVVGPVRGMYRLRRSTSRGEAGNWAAAAAVAMAAAFVTHAAVDWMLSIPGLAMLGMVAVGMAAGVGDGSALRGTATGRGRAVVFGACVLGCAAIVLPTLSSRNVAVAIKAAGSDPGSSLSHLATASRLAPWSPEPWRQKAIVLSLEGEHAAAATAARHATAKAPEDWVSWELLAQEQRFAGDRSGAAASERKARALNPRLQGTVGPT